MAFSFVIAQTGSRVSTDGLVSSRRMVSGVATGTTFSTDFHATHGTVPENTGQHHMWEQGNHQSEQIILAGPNTEETPPIGEAVEDEAFVYEFFAM